MIRRWSPRPAARSRESAILVPVPEAEPVVGRLRDRLDRAALWGVPAHVTVLFPFATPDAITGAVIEIAAAAVASVRAFELLVRPRLLVRRGRCLAGTCASRAVPGA